MFGIKFSQSSRLKKDFNAYDWEAGYPLRKDYKNPEFTRDESTVLN